MRTRNQTTAKTRALVRGAIIAAIYTALTLLFAPISYGEVQIRIAESLTLLPVLLPEAVPALAVGCLLANVLGGCTIFDIVFGTLATLLAAIGTYALRQKPLLAASCPVISNGLIVGLMLSVVYSLPPVLTIIQVAVGEALAVALGYGLMKAFKGRIDWKKFQ